MKQAYRVLCHLISLGVVLQAAAIAFGVFGLAHDVGDGKTITEDYEGNFGLAWHGISGTMIIPLLALILFIVSFFAKVPGGVKWAGFVLLDVAAQVALGYISFGVPIIGALHGVNALAIIGLAETAARRVDAQEPVAATA